MLKILSIDTSTDACSAALLAGPQVIERFQIASQQHDQLILQMVDDVLSQAQYSLTDLDAIALARGPGSFIGLRIAISVAQGLAFGADLPIVSVSTLQTLAQGALDYAYANQAQVIIAAIDARMKEIYWDAFLVGAKDDIVESAAQEQVCPPIHMLSNLPPRIQGLRTIGVGNGWQYKEANTSTEALYPNPIEIYKDCYPRASEVARLGKEAFINGEQLCPSGLSPVYIRNQVATPPKHMLSKLT